MGMNIRMADGIRDMANFTRPLLVLLKVRKIVIEKYLTDANSLFPVVLLFDSFGYGHSESEEPPERAGNSYYRLSYWMFLSTDLLG